MRGKNPITLIVMVVVGLFSTGVFRTTVKAFSEKENIGLNLSHKQNQFMTISGVRKGEEYPTITSGWSADEPLMPTGDSTQDTANLQAAIHDDRLDVGGTMYLGPGTFLVHATIFRQAAYRKNEGYNPTPFNGTIQGAGKGVTFIRSVRGPNGEPFTPIYDESTDQILPATFFIFNEEYFGIRDLTFEAESEIADPYWYAGYYTRGLFSFVGLGSGTYGVGNSTGTDCIDVHFKGSLDSNGRPEIPYLYEPYGGNGGTHNVKSSEFENGLWALLKYGLQAGSTINIGGSPSEKVTFKNAYEASIVVGCADCIVNISYIETKDAPGLQLWALPKNTYSRVSMTQNNINPVTNSWWAGAEIWGWAGEVNAEISNNKIHSEGSFLYGPIFTEGVQNGVITNNIITGWGPAAIYLGVESWLPGKVTLVGNNLQNWETTGPNPWGFTAAPIWLGPFVTDSIVVGGSNKVNIFDEPVYDTSWNPLYDEEGNPLTIPGYGGLIPKEEFGNLVLKSNIFTGVNNVHLNIGQDIREVMKQMVETKKTMVNNCPR